MRTLNVAFQGGPLDGTTRSERVPVHWKFLRFEHKVGPVVHVYSGPLDSVANVVLEYCEAQLLDAEDWREVRDGE